MPHDRNGQLLQAGDKVMIPATVKEIYSGEEFCNVSLGIGSEDAHGPHNVQSSVTLNAKQVEKVEQ